MSTEAPPKIYFVLGTVAELIKMMGVLQLLSTKRIPYKVVLTGQHDLRSSELWAAIGPPAERIVLWERPVKKSIPAFARWALSATFAGIRAVQRELHGRRANEIAWVVMGDTVSTGIGAWLGWIFGMKVMHVEAGLTSGRWLIPFPEEMTRRFASWTSTLLFCPNAWCASNVASARGRIVNTFQNTIADSLKLALAREPVDPVVLDARREPYFVFSIHRQENVYNARVFQFLLEKTLEACGDRRCLFMMYDLTVARAKELGLWQKIESHPSVRLVPRMPYLQYMHLLKNSDFLITDGGSNQEDCYLLGLPCLLLREVTERTEGLGENVVMSMNDAETIARFIANAKSYARPPATVDKSPSAILLDAMLAELDIPLLPS